MSNPARKSRAAAAVIEMGGSQSFAQEAYEKIEEMIVTHRLPPGAAVSETMLSELLGMSRTPVGEALQRLALAGLVTILPRRGILVTEVSAKQLLHLLELRRELDRFVARSAARRATDDERAGFDAVAKAFSQAARSGDETALLKADKTFHTLIGTAARNEFALRSIELMDGLSRRFWYAHRRKIGDLALSAKLHAQVANAIAAGDEEAAAKASDKLVDYLEKFTLATMHTDV